MKREVFTVLTGDVVSSAELEDYGESLSRVFDQFEKYYSDKLPHQVDRYSGDQFQVLLESSRLSLRAALYIYTKLVSLDTPVPVRISIALGKIDGIPEDRVSTGDGEAFRLSGSNLDGMRKHQRITFDCSDDVFGRETSEIIRGSLDLLSAILIDLSPAQAQVTWYKLQGYTQTEIASKTDRRQQTVSDISIAGNWRSIQSFLEVYEEIFD